MNTHQPICDDVRAALPLWSGGDLEADEALRVSHHLVGCDACREAANAAHQARVALGGELAQVAGSAPDLWPGIRATLAAEGRLGGPPVGDAGPVLAGPGGGWLPRLALGVSAAAAALFLTVRLFDSAPSAPSETHGPVAVKPVVRWPGQTPQVHTAASHSPASSTAGEGTVPQAQLASDQAPPQARGLRKAQANEAPLWVDAIDPGPEYLPAPPGRAPGWVLTRNR